LRINHPPKTHGHDFCSSPYIYPAYVGTYPHLIRAPTNNRRTVQGENMKLIAMMSLAALCSLTATLASAEEYLFRAAVDSTGVQRVEVMGGGYFFKPNHIIVKVNVPVEMSVRKEHSLVPHNIVMNSPEAGMDFNITLSEEPKLIKFTATKTGIFPMYCNKKLLFFESHREKGMEGRVEVIP
jgi:plastocyanin